MFENFANGLDIKTSVMLFVYFLAAIGVFLPVMMSLWILLKLFYVHIRVTYLVNVIGRRLINLLYFFTAIPNFGISRQLLGTQAPLKNEKPNSPSIFLKKHVEKLVTFYNKIKNTETRTSEYVKNMSSCNTSVHRLRINVFLMMNSTYDQTSKNDVAEYKVCDDSGICNLEIAWLCYIVKHDNRQYFFKLYFYLQMNVNKWNFDPKFVAVYDIQPFSETHRMNKFKRQYVIDDAAMVSSNEDKVVNSITSMMNELTAFIKEVNENSDSYFLSENSFYWKDFDKNVHRILTSVIKEKHE